MAFYIICKRIVRVWTLEQTLDTDAHRPDLKSLMQQGTVIGDGDGLGRTVGIAMCRGKRVLTGDHLSLRISRQILPSRSMFGL